MAIGCRDLIIGYCSWSLVQFYASSLKCPEQSCRLSQLNWKYFSRITLAFSFTFTGSEWSPECCCSAKNFGDVPHITVDQINPTPGQWPHSTSHAGKPLGMLLALEWKMALMSRSVCLCNIYFIHHAGLCSQLSTGLVVKQNCNLFFVCCLSKLACSG